MTLVYQRKVEGPKTHAFVIGCGRFKHLPAEQARPGTAAGARDMARCLLDNADNLVAPLASLEVLISDPAVKAGKDRLEIGDIPEGGKVKGFTGAVKAATSGNYRTAGTSWKNRLKDGDVMLFYLSSHGVADSALTALALFEDVETDGDTPWEQSVDVSLLANGLMAKGAADAWLFLDACQEFQPAVQALQARPAGVRLINGQTGALTGRGPTALGATSAGNLAYAPDDGTAPYFTKALLRGLKGACVDSWPSLGWVVTSEKLVFGLSQVAAAACGYYDLSPQVLVSRQVRAPLLKVANPTIPVALTTVPSAFLPRATIKVKGRDGLLALPAALPGRGALQFDVEPDGFEYKIEGTAPGRTFAPTSFRAFASAQLPELK